MVNYAAHVYIEINDDFFLLSLTKGQTAAAAVQEIVLSTEHNGVEWILILMEHYHYQNKEFWRICVFLNNTLNRH